MNKAYTIFKEWHVDYSWTLFLDRDGVINKKMDGYIRDWNAFSFIHKVPESIAFLNQQFHKTIIVTNQQGIDKGLMLHEDLTTIHRKMLEILEYYEAQIDEIYYEPSLAAFDSFRRKPNPGMLLDAKKHYPSIDLKKSILIGDSLVDIEAAKKVGAKAIWVENPRNQIELEKIHSKMDFSVGGLHDFCSLFNEQKN